MNKNDIMEDTVQALGYEGEGVIRKKPLTVFVPRTVPGDRIRYRVRQVKGKNVRGDLTDIIQPSQRRVKPDCNSFLHGCGGCQWLHIDYREQLAWKFRLLKDTLKFRGNLDIPVRDIIGMKNPFRCRNKLSLLVRKGELVFMQEDSDRTIRIDRCNQESSPNQTVFGRIRKLDFPEEILQVHLRSSTDGSVGICFFIKKMTADINRISGRIMKENREVAGIGVSGYRDYHTVAGKGYLEQKISGLVFRIPLNGFFQTNTQQAEVLLDLILKAAGTNRNADVLDLYCGAGFFSLPLAGHFRSVTGVENHPESVRNAAANASLNRIANVRFLTADAGKFLVEQNPGRFRIVVLDPPRSGCEPSVLASLLRLKPEKILYISCSPESLARDLSVLMKNSYAVRSCQPVDMFPQTYHIETLVELEYSPQKKDTIPEPGPAAGDRARKPVKEHHAVKRNRPV